MYYVYLLKSIKNSKSYVGQTSKDVNIRLSEHNIGSNFWTKSNGPFTLVYFESYNCREDALLRERFFKSGVGCKIKKLILENFGD